MRRLVGSLIGGALGLVLGAALILFLMSASQSRREARGEIDPGAGQADALYVYLGFVLIPVLIVVGVAAGRALARPAAPSGTPPPEVWSPPGASEVNRIVAGRHRATPGRNGDDPPP